MIESIQIKNYKCFTDSEVKLNHLTIFAGSNGVGKSTVIQSLLLVRQTIDAFEHDFSRKLDKNRDSIANQAIIDFGKETENWAINSKILLNNSYLMQLGNSKEIINSATNSQQIEFILKTKNHSATFGYDASVSSLSLLSNQVSSSIINEEFNIAKNSFHYLNAERLGPRNIQEITEQTFNSTGFQGELTGQALHKSEVLNLKLENDDKRIYETSDNKSLNKISSQVEAWMKYIIPEIEVRIDPFPEINTVRVSLKKQGSGSDFLHPNNIGFGITYVLPIVVTGLIAEKGSMFIVENPEAHLHPSGQSRIGQFLSKIASENIQVVVETHSEHFINGVRLGCMKEYLPNTDVLINFFSQESSAKVPEISRVKITESGDLTEWPYGFFDQEQQDFAEMSRIKKNKK
jgi:predicted ATPase